MLSKTTWDHMKGVMKMNKRDRLTLIRQLTFIYSQMVEVPN